MQSNADTLPTETFGVGRKAHRKQRGLLVWRVFCVFICVCLVGVQLEITVRARDMVTSGIYLLNIRRRTRQADSELQSLDLVAADKKDTTDQLLTQLAFNRSQFHYEVEVPFWAVKLYLMPLAARNPESTRINVGDPGNADKYGSWLSGTMVHVLARYWESRPKNLVCRNCQQFCG